jgi:hypothetical protein
MNDWFEVHALLDDELPPQQRAQVQESIKASPECAAEWHAVRELKAVVNAKCVRPECEELWTRCCKRLNEIDNTKRVESFVGRYAWGICSVFMCFIVGAAMLNRTSGNSLRTGDVARVSSSLVPISAPRSQGTDDKRRWLQDFLDKTMPVQPERITIISGATGFLPDGRKISRADLQDNGGRLGLIVVDSADHLEDAEQVDGHSQYFGGRFNNVNCIAWTDHGHAYFLVGDRARGALCQVADSLYARYEPAR